MAFGFDTIFGAVEVAYLTTVGEALPFYYGETERHEHDNVAPCVIVLHRGGQHESATRQFTGYEEARTNPVHVAHAVERFRFEARGNTDVEAYDLWLRVCSILKTLAEESGWVVELGDFGWTTEQPNVASPMLAWHEKWQDFTITTVVPKLWPPGGGTLQPTVRVETTGHDATFAPTTDPDPRPAGCGHDPDE